MVEKIGYSLGDCLVNLVFQMMMIYQIKFYMDIFGLEGVIVGMVMLVVCIMDVFVDFIVGLLSDCIKICFGKYCLWVFWIVLFFMVFYVLVFYNLGIEDKGLVVLYVMLFYILLMSFYFFNNMLYVFLGGVMFGDIKECISIIFICFVVVIIVQFVVQGFMFFLVSKFLDGGDKVYGWLCIIFLFVCIGFVFLVIIFFLICECIELFVS